MKKDTILILIAVAAILALVLPKPAGMIIPLIILIPVVIYLIVDIIKNGNKEKKVKSSVCITGSPTTLNLHSFTKQEIRKGLLLFLHLQSYYNSRAQGPVPEALRDLAPLLFYPKNTLPAASDRAGCCHGHGLGLRPPLRRSRSHAYPGNTGHISA